MLDYVQNIAVLVHDQQRALTFYRDVLGFEVRNDQDFMPDARFITVAPPGAQTEFALWPVTMQGMEGRQPGGFQGMSFKTSDIVELYKTLGQRGVNFTVPPQQVPWGWNAMFADPDGNVFNVVQHS
jgi:predicted enzyme related to lactoylglutathione lyase